MLLFHIRRIFLLKIRLRNGLHLHTGIYLFRGAAHFLVHLHTNHHLNIFVFLLHFSHKKYLFFSSEFPAPVLDSRLKILFEQLFLSTVRLICLLHHLILYRYQLFFSTVQFLFYCVRIFYSIRHNAPMLH